MVSEWRIIMKKNHYAQAVKESEENQKLNDMESNSQNNFDENSMTGKIRTDLALEVRESFEEDVEIHGVVVNEDYNKKLDIKVTTVEIKDEHGAKMMGKPIGTYITIEAPKLKESDESYHEPISEEIAKYIKQLSNNVKSKEVLVAGLGNREVTPDILGPMVVDHLFVTRHLIEQYGEEFQQKHKLGNVAAIAPGVMAQTGMETSEIIRGIVEQTHPKLVIVIDALAARNVNRLNTTVQLTDTGISPGSGVGNHRNALNKETLGVDVIALGVPTVVDAATIVHDTLETFMNKSGFSEEEIQQFTHQVSQETIHNMFVTPKNIDDTVKRISYTISEALNQCFS